MHVCNDIIDIVSIIFINYDDDDAVFTSILTVFQS